MGEIVNLKRARKARDRADKERKASLNRVRFGTSKTEQKITLARSEKASADLEAKKLDPDKPLDR
jgi:hypothetical protein